MTFIYEMTALHIALEKDNLEIIKTLLSCQNIDVNIKYNLEKHSKFADMTYKANEEKTSLCMAIEKENIEAVRLLLSFKNINVNTPLKRKSESYRKEDQLVVEKEWWWSDEYFGKLEIKEEKTPLFISVEKGNLEIVKLLLPCKDIQPNLLSKSYICYNEDNIRKQKEKLRTALHEAVEKNNAEMVQEILKKWIVNINLFEKVSKVLNDFTYYYAEKTALHIAVENENNEIIGLLLSIFDINVNIIRKEYKKPHESIKEDDHNYDHWTSKKEETAIIIAIEKNNVSIVQLLLARKNIDVNQLCTFKYVENDFSLRIMEHSKNWAYQDYGERYYIEYENEEEAIKNKDENNPEYYLHLPIYVDNNAFTVEMKITALNIAIKEQRIEIIKLLLENENIDVNAKSFVRQKSQTEEKTALHLAVEKGNQEIIKILLNQPKIDINAKDENWKTPIEYSQNEQIIQLFNHYVNDCA